MRPVAWATGSVSFSVRGYKVPSELSEPSGTPRCFRCKLALFLMDYLGTKHNFSNVFHLQLDGQQERLNQPIEAYQRLYHNLTYNNSAEILVMVEYAHIYSKHSSKIIFPINSNYRSVIVNVE